ncbi:MAG TPA: ATP-binding protein [Actinomycetota bacterium]|nr:ATP-binding protein [Actinomycetota bacterium]
MTAIDRRRWPGALRTVFAGLLPPGILTLAALLPIEVETTTAALAYVLAVVVASATGGLIAGLVASGVSFLALNFFFTPPLHTFAVEETVDLVALAVFLAVSATVGAMLSRVLEQRARAERREREARLLNHLGSRLRTGEPTEDVLRSLAASITESFDLARCEITTDQGDAVVAVGRPIASDAREEVMPITTHDRELGRIAVFTDGTRAPLSAEERGVIRTLAGQVALAVESERLGSEAERARLESETNRLRAALFSSVTHDLRTPLSSITASVSTLLDERDGSRLASEDRRELLETIDQEAGRLNRVIGNLMDLSRMRAGAVAPVRTPAAVDELIEGTLASAAAVLKDHDLRLMLRDDLPEIPLDLGLIDQALTNVLENAARFTPPGKAITVVAARWREGVQIRVSDSGPGIPREDRERVFEPFVRGEASAGTGLGLAIARAIVEAHDGTIRLGDEPGGGTAVVIELPGTT